MQLKHATLFSLAQVTLQPRTCPNSTSAYWELTSQVDLSYQPYI